MTMSQSDPNLERAAKIDIATLSDAMDKLGIVGQCLGIKPLEHGFRLTGRAFTLEYGPFAAGGTVGDFIDDVVPRLPSSSSTITAEKMQLYGAIS